MDYSRRITRIYHTSKEIPFDDRSRIILMSDCHRGDGSWADDFLKNENIYSAALNYYYKMGYTYIELGDGDELWGNRCFKRIVEAHIDVFKLLSNFYKEGRLYFIYGNHDIVKRNEKFVRNNLYKYFDEFKNRYIPLFPNIEIYEGLVLKYKNTDNKILLTHGHQVDFLNSDLWRLSRFLIRYLWKPLELFGANDPTRTAKNHRKKDLVAMRLSNWVAKEKHMLVTGHNHRPMYPRANEPAYFNSGSCVHPNCITGIEIVDGNIMLVKWCTKAKDDGSLFIRRDILAGPRKIKEFFN